MARQSANGYRPLIPDYENHPTGHKSGILQLRKPNLDDSTLVYVTTSYGLPGDGSPEAGESPGNLVGIIDYPSEPFRAIMNGACQVNDECGTADGVDEFVVGQLGFKVLAYYGTNDAGEHIALITRVSAVGDAIRVKNMAGSPVPKYGLMRIEWNQGTSPQQSPGDQSLYYAYQPNRWDQFNVLANTGAILSPDQTRSIPRRQEFVVAYEDPLIGSPAELSTSPQFRIQAGMSLGAAAGRWFARHYGTSMACLGIKQSPNEQTGEGGQAYARFFRRTGWENVSGRFGRWTKIADARAYNLEVPVALGRFHDETPDGPIGLMAIMKYGKSGLVGADGILRVYKSMDKGDTWLPVGDSEGSPGATPFEVTGRISPSNYRMTSELMQNSIVQMDNGWLVTSVSGGVGYNFVDQPFDNSGIYVSKDYGVTWQRKWNIGFYEGISNTNFTWWVVNFIKLSSSQILAQVKAAVPPNHVSYSGMIKSTDSGETWTPSNRHDFWWNTSPGLDSHYNAYAPAFANSYNSSPSNLGLNGDLSAQAMEYIGDNRLIGIGPGSGYRYPWINKKILNPWSKTDTNGWNGNFDFLGLQQGCDMKDIGGQIYYRGYFNTIATDGNGHFVITDGAWDDFRNVINTHLIAEGKPTIANTDSTPWGYNGFSWYSNDYGETCWIRPVRQFHYEYGNIYGTMTSAGFPRFYGKNLYKNVQPNSCVWLSMPDEERARLLIIGVGGGQLFGNYWTTFSYGSSMLTHYQDVFGPWNPGGSSQVSPAPTSGKMIMQGVDTAYAIGKMQGGYYWPGQESELSSYGDLNGPMVYAGDGVVMMLSIGSGISKLFRHRFSGICRGWPRQQYPEYIGSPWDEGEKSWYNNFWENIQV